MPYDLLLGFMSWRRELQLRTASAMSARLENLQDTAVQYFMHAVITASYIRAHRISVLCHMRPSSVALPCCHIKM